MGYKLKMRSSVSVGDKVKIEELFNIYGVHIVVEFENFGDDFGTVLYVGTDETEAAKYDRDDNIVANIYNGPVELSEGLDE